MPIVVLLLYCMPITLLLGELLPKYFAVLIYVDILHTGFNHLVC